MRTFTEFFGFNQDPFKRTPDIDFYYPTKMHMDALDTLNYLIYSDEPFAVITGEPGTGKTITLRKFISELPNNIVCAYILFPNLSPEELFMAILEDFNIHVDKKLTKNALFARLRDFLLEVSQSGKKAVIIVDEAQNLPCETLEELRILSNLETEKDKLLKIILAGQPELSYKLEQDNLRQLKQRVTLYTSLDNIKSEDIKDYINSHLEKVGKSPIKIQNSVIRKIYKITKGNPRLINTIMERTIVAAFLDNSHTIKEEHLNNAILSINNIISTVSHYNVKSIGQFAIAVCIGLVIGFVSYFGLDKLTSKDEIKTALVVENNKQEIEPKTQVQETKKIEEYKEEPKVLENHVSSSQETKEEQVNNNINTQEVAVNTQVEDNKIAETKIEENTAEDPKPAEIPVETPRKKEVLIHVNSLNVRGKPDLESVRVGAVKLGERYDYVREFDDWVEIRLSPTLTGWVFKRYVQISDK